ncbi:MAG: hypothetical protein JSU07_02045 [Bacteroidetes bacterium]|nr:hypothetical protein [Bacteroidota bacterium]
MLQNSEIIKSLLSKKQIGLVISINDLRDKEFSGIKLSPDEKFALSNYDNYRLKVLNNIAEEDKFHQSYRQLQVIANLSDWREFLKEEFSK